MFLPAKGGQFEDTDNYFVELAKGTSKIVLQVSTTGDLIIFKQLLKSDLYLNKMRTSKAIKSDVLFFYEGNLEWSPYSLRCKCSRITFRVMELTHLY